MIINELQFECDGYFHCHSRFYSSISIISNNKPFTFYSGINELVGERDSGGWAISYLLSMYTYKRKDSVINDELTVFINNQPISIKDLSKYTCYMDETYPLFSTRLSARRLIANGLKTSKSNLKVEEVKALFQLDDQRFERPISQMGNESIRAMAAVGYSYGKEVFCFPWLSQSKFESYQKNIVYAIEMLEKLNKMIILPCGK